MKAKKHGRILFLMQVTLLAMFATCASADIIVGNYYSGDVFQYTNNGGFVRGFAVNDSRISSLGGMTQQQDGTILISSTSFGVPGSDDILKYDPVTSAYLGKFAQIASFTTDSGRPILADVSIGPSGDVFAGLLRSSTIRRYDGVTGPTCGNIY